MSSGQSLQARWNLNDPGKPQDDAQSKAFRGDFKQAMAPVVEALQYTLQYADPAAHDALTAKGDRAYQDYQDVLKDIDPGDPSKAEKDIEKVIDSVDRLAGEALTLKSETEEAVRRWQARETGTAAGQRPGRRARSLGPRPGERPPERPGKLRKRGRGAALRRGCRSARRAARQARTGLRGLPKTEGGQGRIRRAATTLRPGLRGGRRLPGGGPRRSKAKPARSRTGWARSTIRRRPRISSRPSNFWGHNPRRWKSFKRRSRTTSASRPSTKP